MVYITIHPKLHLPFVLWTTLLSVLQEPLVEWGLCHTELKYTQAICTRRTMLLDQQHLNYIIV